MAAPRNALGRGLGALLPSSSTKPLPPPPVPELEPPPPHAVSEVASKAVKTVRPNPIYNLPDPVAQGAATTVMLSMTAKAAPRNSAAGPARAPFPPENGANIGLRDGLLRTAMP